MPANISDVIAEVKSCLLKDENVIAATIFGSAATGETWERSDIDMFVVLRGPGDIHDAGYLDKDTLTVHLQLISKSSLMKALKGTGGGPFHNAFGSGRMLFCRDSEVESLFASCSEPSRESVDLRITEAFGNMLANMYRAEKSLRFSRPADSLRHILAACEEWARIEVLRRGSYPSRDVFAQSGGFCQQLDRALRILHHQQDGRIEETVQRVLDLIREYKTFEAGALGRDVMTYISSEGPQSAVNLESCDRYKGLRTSFELIADALVEEGLLVKDTRDFRLPGGQCSLGDEIVYDLRANLSNG